MRWFGWLSAALALDGCSLERPDPGGGQIGEEGTAHCEVVERTPLGRDEVSALGFSAAEVLAFAVGTFEDALVYEGGGSAALAVVITEGTEGTEGAGFELQHQELVVTGSGAAIEPACPDQVALDVAVTFTTDDGVFAEAWDGALLAMSADQAWLTRDLAGAAGSFDPRDYAPAGSDYDEVRAWLDLTVAPSGLSGSVVGQGSGVIGDPDDPDSTAYAESFDIAGFGTESGE
jgi:hypothetical protein